MFWSRHDHERYESRLREDMANLFGEYGEIRRTILSESHGLAAASHLANRIRYADGEALRQRNLEAEMSAIVARLTEHSFVDHRTCLQFCNEKYDSPAYLITGTSRAPDDSDSRIAGALNLITRTSFAPVVARIDSMALVTLIEEIFPNTNQSYTLKNIFMTVYLDLYESEVLIAESIVHEHAHMTFNNYVYLDKYYYDPTLRYYSPWKQCMRPIFNFVHSLIAFADVIKFITEVSAFNLDAIDRKYVDMKLVFESRNMLSVQESAMQVVSDLPDREIASRIAAAFDAAL